MRSTSMRWPLVMAVMVVILAWFLGPSTGMRAQLAWLASQPGVQTAFQGDGASTDALLTLLAFVIIVPLGFVVLIVGLCFMVKAIGGPFARLHLPEWASTVLVVAACSWGTYALRDWWLAGALYVLGLSARAYLVYTASIPAPPH